MSKNGINIRHAELADQEGILQFIKKHWKEDHVFVVHPDLFEYYHVIDGKLTYVIAEDEHTKEIYGLQGYIASNRSGNPDVWGAIWKTIPTPAPYPFLGIKIMMYIRKCVNSRIFAGCGANPKTTIPLLKFLKEKTGKLNHYYRIADQRDYRIAEILHKNIIPLSESPKYNLIKFNSIVELQERFDIEKYKKRKPYKDGWYINRRYFEHPINDYQVYGIDKGDHQIDSILIAREQDHNEAKILRILDFIGVDTDLVGIGQWIQNVIEERHYEYVDCYCVGISNEIMNQAGFSLRDETDNNIIPNYFEPFVKGNIDIYYNTSENEDFYVFKADSDQDRPNIKK
ncbi:hypothetical protein [Paenibacillus peoriae]|uniref:hypothetical protein n=1 Tax=Paenibacillus peoriae TaxID=59893 RepID=UPI00096CDADB|nr:hypothetical protein [Paenibacillus peoriae]OMF49985.1 hypothetical protein BK135_06065 [Paenibacillus peoriae]